jgi:hypothetical protein
MAIRVEITRADLMPRLMEALARSGCFVRGTSANTLDVVHPKAPDEREARLELAFFLRAWELDYPGAGLRITS